MMIFRECFRVMILEDDLCGENGKCVNDKGDIEMNGEDSMVFNVVEN